MSLRDQELHALDEWIEAVEQARADLGVVAGSHGEVSQRLAQLGESAVVACVRARFRRVVRLTGLHDRYVEYFAACVTSHFEDGDVHRVPAWLREYLRRWRSSENPVPAGTVRMEFLHGRPIGIPPSQGPTEMLRIAYTETLHLTAETPEQAVPGASAVAAEDPDWSITEPTLMVITRSPDPEDGLAVSPERQPLPVGNLLGDLAAAPWVRVPMPYGLEVLWPYEVPMMSLNESDLSAMGDTLRLAGVPTSWILMDRLVAFHDGRWLMLPPRAVENLPGLVDLHTLFGLPRSALIATLAMPIPLVEDGSGLSHVIELEDSPPPGQLRPPWVFRHLGEVRPLQPKVTVDRTVPNDEAGLVDAWNRLSQMVAVHPTVRPGRGAPPKRTRVPGLHVYSKVVASLYRRKLVAWGRDWLQKAHERGEQAPAVPDPPREERRLLWDSARREARGQIPQEARDPIPDGTREAVEHETPWRVTNPAAPTGAPPVG